MNEEQWDFLDVISILSFIIGLQNLELNQRQVDGLMSEMRDNQNSMLHDIIKQNEIIIQQNEELLKLLGEKNSNERKNWGNQKGNFRQNN